MPLVGRRVESFALEDVSEMTAAVLASDLDSFHAPTPVRVSINGTWNGVEEGRPTATGIELGGRLVERRVTTCACVDTLLGVMLVVLARSCHFSALLAKDAELLWVELGAPFGVGHALGERFGSGLGRCGRTHLESWSWRRGKEA